MKFFLKTYGCAHNQADSEFIEGLLIEEGHESCNSITEADLIIINTCTVKDPSEKKLYSEIKSIKKPLIIAGCVPQADKENPELKKYSLVGINHIDKIVSVAEKTFQGQTIHKLNKSNKLSLNMPKKRKKPLIEIIPISNGCMGTCTFCKTKLARGGLVSFPPEQIIKRIRDSLNEGVKEIWLTSEDTGAYGKDIDSNLVELLEKILEIQKDFRLRIGMINPEHVTSMVDDLIRILKDRRIFKFLHVPVQSGNNQVLKDMNRPYTVEEFCKIVEKLKSAIPDIKIATDVICGFPTETKDAFQDTLKLVERFRFPILNISKFYPRPNTKAAKMKLLPTSTVKKRSLILSELNNSFFDDSSIGKIMNVLVDDLGSKNDLRSRTNNYSLVILQDAEDLQGKFLDVRIISANRNYLIGVPLKE